MTTVFMGIAQGLSSHQPMKSNSRREVKPSYIEDAIF